MTTAVDHPPAGGPGASGIGFIPSIGPLISQQLGGTYDIISWDPRGVGDYTLHVSGLTLTLHTHLNDAAMLIATSPGEVTCFDTPRRTECVLPKHDYAVDK